MASSPLSFPVAELLARHDRSEEAIRLYSLVAEQYADDGDFVTAIELYRKVSRFYPTRLEVYERLAELYWCEGLLAQARDQYLLLADYYRQNGRLEEVAAVRERLDELERVDKC